MLSYMLPAVEDKTSSSSRSNLSLSLNLNNGNGNGNGNGICTNDNIANGVATTSTATLNSGISTKRLISFDTTPSSALKNTVPIATFDHTTKQIRVSNGGPDFHRLSRQSIMSINHPKYTPSFNTADSTYLTKTTTPTHASNLQHIISTYSSSPSSSSYLDNCGSSTTTATSSLLTHSNEAHNNKAKIIGGDGSKVAVGANPKNVTLKRWVFLFSFKNILYSYDNIYLKLMCCIKCILRNSIAK